MWLVSAIVCGKLMSELWNKVSLWLKLGQIVQTVQGCFALWWYATTHYRVLRIVPVNTVFHRQIFFTGVEAWGVPPGLIAILPDPLAENSSTPAVSEVTLDGAPEPDTA